MKTISLRQFQLKPSLYLTELPLTLTVYGNPVATVNTFTGEIEKSVNTPTVENLESLEEAPEEEKPVPFDPDDDTLDEEGFLKPGNRYDFEKMKSVKKWCGLNLTHPYGDPQDCYCVTGEDENGQPVKHGKLTLVNIYGCAKCIESLPYTVMTGNPNG